jgi:hypothetical protein
MCYCGRETTQKSCGSGQKDFCRIGKPARLSDAVSAQNTQQASAATAKVNVIPAAAATSATVNSDDVVETKESTAAEEVERTAEVTRPKIRVLPGYYSCRNVCGLSFSCGNHICTRTCHRYGVCVCVCIYLVVCVFA